MNTKIKKFLYNALVAIIEVSQEGIEFLFKNGILVPLMKATIFIFFIDDLCANKEVTFASWVPVIFFGVFGLVAFVIKWATEYIIVKEKEEKRRKEK